MIKRFIRVSRVACSIYSGCTRDTRVAEMPPSGNLCSFWTRATSVSSPKINFTHRTTLRSTCRHDTWVSLLRFLSHREPSPLKKLYTDKEHIIVLTRLENYYNTLIIYKNAIASIWYLSFIIFIYYLYLLLFIIFSSV